MAKLNQAMTDLLRYNAAILPQKRSMFDKSHSHTTTMDSAYLVPLMWDRVLPGDEKKIRVSALARMATPIHPVMDEAKFDVWAFYVPDRLWWSHAREFYGENKDASFNADGQYVMPSVPPSFWRVNPKSNAEATSDGIHSLNDYFGFPIMRFENDIDGSDTVFDDVQALRASAGLHRSYQLIWNEYFRNSSVQPALQLSTGDTITFTEWLVDQQIRKVCKLPDFFTTLLREPQAGDDVSLPLSEWAPVVSRDHAVSRAYGAEKSSDSADVQVHTAVPRFSDDVNGSWSYRGDYLRVATLADGKLRFQPIDNTNVEINPLTGANLYPQNLWADLSSASLATINNIRAAVTVQQLLELDAMAGKRYQQILQAHFGVFVPDGTLQRPELLGASRTSVGMRQVLQTSATDDVSPQGNTAAFSVTNVSNEWICNKAFTEPGFIMVLGAVRPVHSYSQGLNPLLTKLNRYDHYYPVFDNLGNQPIPNSAIYATYRPHNVFTTDYYKEKYDDVFGYAEAWTEYRIMPNRVSGLMRPDIGMNGDEHGSLASWNYSQNFGSDFPVLNSAFVEEDPQLIDRTIAVTTEPQFLVDVYFDYMDTKSMGVHSIPGLMRL